MAGPAQQPAATVAQFAGHINLFPAIVRDDLSGADPGARPPRPSHLHIFVTTGAGSSEKKKKKKGREGRQDRRRDDELCLAIWALFLQRPQIKTQPVWRGGGGGGGGEGGKQNCQKATILLISFSLCALSKEGERKKGALIIRGVESSNR